MRELRGVVDEAQREYCRMNGDFRKREIENGPWGLTEEIEIDRSNGGFEHYAEQQLAAHQRTLQTIQKCHIDNIFTESKFLQAKSLEQLAKALIWAA
ncbi:hypothetical protein RYX36_025005 [Vicia faba]